MLISIPKEFSRFEQEVRKWVGDEVSRGQVSVRIFLLSSAPEEFLPDIEMLKGLKKGWEKIARELGIDPKGVDLPFLMQTLPAQQKSDCARDGDLSALRQCVEEALQSLVKMKKTEGKALQQDLSERLKELERMIDEIEGHSPDATKKMERKLFEKMEEMVKANSEIKESLLKEVILFAGRVDIAEEITRFRSHVVQFKELLKGVMVGRKMDFLIQEMGREVNTIASKSMEAKISHLVVDMKSELEKMREQVQNIE